MGSFVIFFLISWRLITLQYCSGFCHTWTWISHGFTCVPHSDPPPTSLSTRSLWVFPVHQARVLVSCIQPGLVLCFTLDNIHVLMLFSWNSWVVLNPEFCLPLGTRQSLPPTSLAPRATLRPRFQAWREARVKALAGRLLGEAVLPAQGLDASSSRRPPEWRPESQVPLLAMLFPMATFLAQAPSLRGLFRVVFSGALDQEPLLSPPSAWGGNSIHLCPLWVSAFPRLVSLSFSFQTTATYNVRRLLSVRAPLGVRHPYKGADLPHPELVHFTGGNAKKATAPHSSPLAWKIP